MGLLRSAPMFEQVQIQGGLCRASWPGGEHRIQQNSLPPSPPRLLGLTHLPFSSTLPYPENLLSWPAVILSSGHSPWMISWRRGPALTHTAPASGAPPQVLYATFTTPRAGGKAHRTGLSVILLTTDGHLPFIQAGGEIKLSCVSDYLCPSKILVTGPFCSTEDIPMQEHILITCQGLNKRFV